MSDRLLIDIGIAATRWHAIAQRRQAASSHKRRLDEACRKSAPVMGNQWLECSDASARLSEVKREERKSLKALAVLCDSLEASRKSAQDVTEVQEVRMLPHRITEKGETAKQVELPEVSIANHQASQA